MQKMNLDSLIEDVKKIEDISKPSNIISQEQEDQLKSKIVEIDGYTVVFLFKREIDGPFCLESLHLKSLHFKYLPFHIVAKLGKKFLGKHHLRLVERMVDDKKTYEWRIIVDRTGRPVEVELYDHIAFEECVYDDFHYTYIY